MANSPAQKNVRGSAIQVGQDQIRFNKIDYELMSQAANSLAARPEQQPAESEKQPAPPPELNLVEQQLRASIDRYFDLVAEELDQNEVLQEESLKRLQNAQDILNRREGNDLVWTISRAQFEVRRVHVAIAKEQQFQRNEATLRLVVPGLVLVYVLAVIGLIIFGNRNWNQSTDIPIIGVPLAIVVWAVIGSIAAILYRFYNRDRSLASANEIRWLIARPIIGVIMGGLSYLAILSGLFIFGSSSSDPSATRPQLFYVIAFLGGFSDKFYEAIIDTVVGRFGANKPADPAPAAPPPPSAPAAPSAEAEPNQSAK